MAATNTQMTSFQQGVAEYVVHNILTPISTWLAEHKKCTCSVDELMAALQVPSSARSAIPAPAGAGFPTFNPPAASAPTTTTRTKKSVAHDGPKCQYKFVRGARKDQLCEEPVVPGTMFCKACSKKKNAIATAGGSASSSSTQTGGFNTAKAAPAAPATQASGTTDVMVLPIKDKPGFFKTTEGNFIVQSLSDNVIVARGIDENGTIRPMTEAERTRAEALGFSVDEEDDSSPAGTPAPSSAPAAPVAPLPTVAPTATGVIRAPVVIPRSH